MALMQDLSTEMEKAEAEANEEALTAGSPKKKPTEGSGVKNSSSESGGVQERMQGRAR